MKRPPSAPNQELEDECNIDKTLSLIDKGHSEAIEVSAKILALQKN